jgi:hypothetical protein
MSATPVRSAPAARARSWLSGLRNLPLWPFGELTAQQLKERAHFEASMRGGQLRGLPSAFGQLG